jgi:hypothetical protein
LPEDYPSFAATLGQRTSLLDRIKALSPAQAIGLAKAMEPLLAERQAGLRAAIQGVDPEKRRLSSGDAAQRVLEMWAVMDDKVDDWERAVGQIDGVIVHR